MVLLPKEFQINPTKLDARFKAITSSNYDGIFNDGNSFLVMWKSTPSNQDLAVIENYWNSLTEQVYNAPTAAETQAYYAAKLIAATNFGMAMIVEVALSNISMGITQAGKTRAVSDYTAKLQGYLRTGSLYAAIEEIQDLRNDLTRPLLGLSPFITDARLDEYKAKIQAFLAQ